MEEQVGMLESVKKLDVAAKCAIDDVTDAALAAIGKVKHEKMLVEQQRDQLLSALKSALSTNDALHFPDHEYCDEWRGELSSMRAAVAAVEHPASAEPNGWIEWKGGACPVDGDVGVEVKFRDGSQSNDAMPACCLRWTDDCREASIVAYRVVEGGAS